MAKQLFIPDKVAVGFQTREGTYTGKLAYVIYYDQKGTLRKEKSWQSWRDNKIPPVDFENVPTEGFVLNKGVGGARQSYGWNARNEYIRVYDPRDFEFEISVANLLFILRECDCSKGKGLEGKFVYAWDGTELVLLPEISTDYQQSKVYTQLQACGVKAKDMVPGCSYTTKRQETWIYLGRLDYHYITGDNQYSCWRRENTISRSARKKQHVFWDGKRFVFKDDMKSIAVLSSDTPVPDYAELLDKYNKSVNGSKIVRLFTKKLKINNRRYYYGYETAWVETSPDGSYSEYYPNYDYSRTTVSTISRIARTTLKDDGLEVVHSHTTFERGRSGWIEPTNVRLFAELENGSSFRIANGQFFNNDDEMEDEDDTTD